MGSEHKYQIFENADGNGVIKHAGANAGLGIGVKGGNTISFGSNGTSDCAQFTAGAGCKLKFDTNTKLETVDGGVTVTGTLTASNITVDQVQINDKTVQATSGDLVLTAPGGVIDINDAVDISDNLVVRASATSNSADTGALQVLNGGAGIKEDLFVGGQIRCSGDITAFASDERLKTNISPITEALSKVKSIDGFTYNFNDTAKELGFDTEVDYAGVSAQKVQKVLPEVVRPAPSGDDYITVQYEKLVPLLIEAIKELSDKVDDLEQKLSDK